MSRGLAKVRRVCALLLSGLLLFSACRARPEAPEEELRQTITQAAEAAQKKDLRALSALLAADFGDDQGRDREAVLGLLRYYFLGHQSLYLLTRIGAIELLAAERARAVVLVAMAGEPLVDPNEPTFMRASLYRFEFDFVRGKDAWMVRGASWQRAEVRDFLLGQK
jgi:hypothetical protein